MKTGKFNIMRLTKVGFFKTFQVEITFFSYQSFLQLEKLSVIIKLSDQLFYCLQ